jgi:predicted nuclease of predicted toxin-antitoxin system
VRFLLDEGLPHRLAAFLVSEGHDVATCGKDLPFALVDGAILASAYRSSRILLTHDKDFGDLVFRDRHPHRGIILFRLGRVSTASLIASLQQVLSEFEGRLDEFIVVSPRGIRVASPLRQVGDNEVDAS